MVSEEEKAYQEAWAKAEHCKAMFRKSYEALCRRQQDAQRKKDNYMKDCEDLYNKLDHCELDVCQMGALAEQYKDQVLALRMLRDYALPRTMDTPLRTIKAYIDILEAEEQRIFDDACRMQPLIDKAGEIKNTIIQMEKFVYDIEELVSLDNF